MIWPAGWNIPSAQVQKYTDEAAEKFGIPAELLYSLIRKESNFRPLLKGPKNATNNETFRRSYEKYRDQVIPGKNPQKLTWGDVFKPEDWTAHGLAQLLPYHIYGKSGGVPVGAPISDMYQPAANIRCAAAYLAVLRAKYPDSWDKVLLVYNGSSAYVRMVAAYVDEFKAARMA